MSYNKDLREKYKVRTMGVSGSIANGTTDSVDYKLMENLWLSGVRLVLNNQSIDDSLDFNIVDKEFLFAGSLYPATPTEAGIPGVDGLSWSQVTPNGVHLDDFGKGYQVATDKEDQGKEEPGYWAELIAGMYIEIKYTSTGATDVNLKANLYFHKEKVQ